MQQESHRIVSAAASMTLIITGVAKTATLPLPTPGAVCSSFDQQVGRSLQADCQLREVHPIHF
jgi:hypothetical protein